MTDTLERRASLWRRRAFLAAGLAAVPAAAAAACAVPTGLGATLGATQLYSKEAAHGAQWAYEGGIGPAHWAELDHTFAACAAGNTQSPVDIVPAKLLKADWLTELQLTLRPTKLHAVNNGHTIQVNCDRGSSLTFEKVTYQLAQFHFHTPSEHLVNGRAADMELHAVFQDAAKHLAVVGVLLQAQTDDAENPLLAKFWHAIPEKEGSVERELTVNVADSLPAEPGYWAYEGSLTTPPCSEHVQWVVMKRPMPVSRAQLAKFRAIFPHNARPVQPLKDRLIKDF
jgi:carbonic anhydrase